MKKHSDGFTVIELLFITFVLALASVFFFVQKSSLQVTADDNMRKVSINAMYYGLEEVFYPANNYYPQTINANNLKSVDPDLFSDPNGSDINTAGSDYTYKPTDCENSRCKGYTLKAALQEEDDYIKKNKR